MSFKLNRRRFMRTRTDSQSAGDGLSERGAVLVESAFTVGILFVLLIAILDSARAYNAYQVLTDAAREGARYSVAPDPNNAYTVPSASQIQTTVKRFIAADHLQGSTVSVSCVYASGTPAPNVAICPPGAPQSIDPTLESDEGLNPVYTKVQVAVPYKFMVLPFSVTMTSKAVMRNENN